MCAWFSSLRVDVGTTGPEHDKDIRADWNHGKDPALAQRCGVHGKSVERRQVTFLPLDEGRRSRHRVTADRNGR
jgi:hypothetical protein